MRFRINETARRESGYSMVELFIVLSIMVIIGAIAIPQLYYSRRLYQSEDQALKVMDLMKETSQLAITRRRTFRFEVDLTANAILIIDERNPDPEFPPPATPVNSPDILVKKVPLEKVSDLRMDVRPAGVSAPPSPYSFGNPTFVTDTIGHLEGSTTVNGNTIWRGRFRSDGSMVNAANTPISVTFYIFPPTTPGNTNARNKKEIRAITLFGGSGVARFWRHNGTAFVPYQ
jgi:type II secretory pathway pseudopilin PulG